MTTEEINILINELKAIRNRKLMKQSIESKLNEIFNLMCQEEFALVSTEYNAIFNPDKYFLCDMSE